MSDESKGLVRELIASAANQTDGCATAMLRFLAAQSALEEHIERLEESLTEARDDAERMRSRALEYREASGDSESNPDLW